MHRPIWMFVAASIPIGCLASLVSVMPARADASEASEGPKSVFSFFAMNFAMHDARYAANGAGRPAQGTRLRRKAPTWEARPWIPQYYREDLQ